MSERPIFWIVAGPNGSGKSSLYGTSDIEDFSRSVWIINPDLLAARLRSAERLDPLTANLEALRRIEAWLDASIQTHQTVGVETVLSTDKYRRLVDAAHSRGFEFRLLYVMLDSPARNIERVRIRVERGGHAVDEDKIVERYYRSLAQLPWFVEQADRAVMFDNTGTSPREMARKRNGVLTITPAALPALVQALRPLWADEPVAPSGAPSIPDT